MPPGFEQFRMFPLFDDLAVPHHQDQIRIFYGAQAVSDDQRGAAFDDGFDGRLNLLLRQGVHGSGGFVQYQNPGIGQNGPGKGNELLFTGGEHIAAFTHVTVQPFFHFVHHFFCGNQLQCPPDFFFRGVGVAIEQVFPDGTGKEVRGLQYIADGRMQPQLAAFPGVPAVDEHLTFCGLKEAAHQVH